MKDIYFKDMKQLVYGYLKNQVDTNQSIQEHYFWGMLFCPDCKRGAKRVEPVKGYYEADLDFYKLRNEITNYYYCERCKKVFHQREGFSLPIHDYMEKFGYLQDCHGYYKEGERR